MCCKGGWKQYMPGPLSRAGGLTLTSDPCWKKKQMTGLGLIFLPLFCVLNLPQKQLLLCLPKACSWRTENTEGQGFF